MPGTALPASLKGSVIYSNEMAPNNCIETLMTKTASGFDFDDMASLFWQLGGLQSPSELQGYLTGQLAAGVVPTETEWLEQAIDYIDCAETPSPEQNQQLVTLLPITLSSLADGAMDYQPMLPDDDVDMAQRVAGVGCWCQGFLTGFTQAGKQLKEQKGPQQYSEDLGELLNDLVSISQVGVDDEDLELEQSEQDYFELCEYLRLAAMSIFLECNQPPMDESSPKEPGEGEALGSMAGLFNKKTLH